MEHPAAYLSRRVRAEHHLSRPATTEELLLVCWQRGVFVSEDPTLQELGVYSSDDVLILLRWLDSPWELAHELFHYLIDDNTSNGIVYAFPDFYAEDHEEEAELFAWLMCGVDE